jgi:hypothetical protein
LFNLGLYWPVLLKKEEDGGGFSPLEDIPIAETLKALENVLTVDSSRISALAISVSRSSKLY